MTMIRELLSPLPGRLALPLLAGVLLTACGKAPEAEAPARPVRLMTVGEGGINPTMELAGEVRARVESRLGFRVGGKITSRRVELGQRVKRGQQLARLDPSNETLGLQAAEARVSSATAERELAATEFRRFSELHQKGYVSATDYDRRRITLESAEAALSQARADMDMARNRVDYAVLLADADGVVVGVDADVGEVVAVGQPIIRVAQDGPLEVQVDIPEDRLPLIRAAHPEISLWASPKQRYPAVLRELSAAADPVTRTFVARYSFKGATAGVSLGQTASVHLGLPANKDGIRVPTTAIVELDGKTGVWVYDETAHTMKRQPVVLAGVDGNDAVIVGVPTGARIAIAGVHVLAEGQKVRPFEEAPASKAQVQAQAERQP